MIGELLFTIITYLILLSVALALVVYFGLRRGLSTPKRGVSIAAGLLILLLTWDWAPTVGMHFYYCETKGGAQVVKSAAEWAKENPQAVKPATPGIPPQVNLPDGYYYMINERVRLEIRKAAKPMRIHERHELLVDEANGATLAELRDYSTGQASGRLEGARELRDLKFWMYRNSCEADGRMIRRKEFNQAVTAYQEMRVTR